MNDATLSVGSDTLSDVLDAVSLTGASFFIVDARVSWAAEAPASVDLAAAILPRVRHAARSHP